MTYNLEDRSILFKKISIQLQNDFDSTLEVSDKYTLSLALCIYRYLSNKYSKLIEDEIEEIIDEQRKTLPEELVDKISYKNRLIDLRANKISDEYLSSVKLYKDITLDPEHTPLEDHIYDRNTSAPKYEYQPNIDSINKITKYNIAFWPISDNILQYVMLNSVVTPMSSLEDIAEMQKLLSNIRPFNYDYTPGIWDYNFSKACYTIQFILHESDETVILTGLCDLAVERYLRSRNETRSTAYNT